MLALPHAPARYRVFRENIYRALVHGLFVSRRARSPISLSTTFILNFRYLGKRTVGNAFIIVTRGTFKLASIFIFSVLLAGEQRYRERETGPALLMSLIYHSPRIRIYAERMLIYAINVTHPTQFARTLARPPARSLERVWVHRGTAPERWW